MKTTLELLQMLEGRWTGKGQGSYPTIEPFEYLETFTFKARKGQPIFHYQQNTEVLDPKRADHFESGFFRVLDSGSIEVSNAQNGGRVEVLEGEVRSTDGGLILALKSKLIANDSRMHSTERCYRFQGNNLEYEMSMATTTTPSQKMGIHLKASLQRES